MKLNLDAFNNSDADKLIQMVHNKVSPIFQKNIYSDEDKRAIYRYLFSRKPIKTPPSMKSRIINLYDPMADRSGHFNDGLRWCVNVYVGCSHNCGYCYVNGYSQENVGIAPHSKKDFEKLINKDFDELRALNVPPSPLHISNSTDAFQEPLERKHGHAYFTLNKIIENRDLFTSITILTKNPKILCDKNFLPVIMNPKMKPIIIQVTCAFWRDDVRVFYEPNAPSVQSRLEAIKILTDKGIETELRIDPLFPSNRINQTIRKHKPLTEYSLPEAQNEEDIYQLIRFAKEANLKGIIAKPLKVPISAKAVHCKNLFGELYKDASCGKRTTRGGSWRLPETYQKAMIQSISNICSEEDISFKHCMHDVLTKK